MTAAPPTLILAAWSLCSKWGFGDGDEPEHLLDYADEIGVDYADYSDGWHAVLRHLVRAHLVPAIERAGHTVEVYDIETNHNPIRARRIDGRPINDYAGRSGCPIDVEVTVTWEQIMTARAATEAAQDAKA